MLQRKNTLFLFWFVIVASGFLILMLISIVAYQDSPSAKPWESSDPLSKDVVGHLCDIFSLAVSDPRCKENSIVYAPNFDDEVIKLVDEGSLANFGDWENILGTYRSYCTPNQKSGYECVYDFHGDDVFLIFVFFDTSGTMIEWRFSVNGD